MHDTIKRRVKTMLDRHEPAHDYQHIMRVYKNAKMIGKLEGANMEILLLAVLLHDLVAYPKGSSKSSNSSDDSADLAERILQSYGYSNDKPGFILYTDTQLL
jgi:uncharacterized protein